MYSEVILALKGITIAVQPGTCVAILGGNGAGKSTTLKAVSGTIGSEDGKVTGGAISFDGQRIDSVDPAEVVRRGLVHVMEGRRVLRHLTAEQNLIVGGHLADGAAELRRRLDRVYSVIPQLAGLRERTAGYLSGGEQQMLVVARAMMAKPRMILIDEPSLGLAPMMVQDVFALLARLKAEGVTLLVVEQNSRVALELADHGYVLENGRVVLEGTADELRRNEDVREFYLGMTASGERKSYREVKHYRRRKRWLG
ncbi:MAG: ABC transporter ATP-binding protein [Burkholderiaceae bacterium]|nr:ABC transporter ATP-binding protein [Burkholderiaceae bacterium]